MSEEQNIEIDPRLDDESDEKDQKTANNIHQYSSIVIISFMI